MSPQPSVEAATAPPFASRALRILWPAFMIAAVLEMLVFAVVDPGQMHWFGAEPIAWSRTAIYSVTFLMFWGAIATSGAITQLLDEPLPPPERAEPMEP